MSITKALAFRGADRLGFVCVGGYPKSGTSWVARLVANVLDLPLVKPFPVLPITFPAVIHHHWSYDPRISNSMVVMRDGRDVMISLYSAVMRGYEIRRKELAGETGPGAFVLRHFGKYNEVGRRLERLYGHGFDPWNVTGNLPRFIEAEFEKPFRWAVQDSWPRYVLGWCGANHPLTVRYEQMLEDPVRALGDLLEKAGREHDAQVLSLAVERYSFERVTGRAPGQEDRGSFARRGIRGEWRSRFNAEARQVFDALAGDALIALGYEKDRRWVHDDSHRTASLS